MIYGIFRSSGSDVCSSYSRSCHEGIFVPLGPEKECLCETSSAREAGIPLTASRWPARKWIRGTSGQTGEGKRQRLMIWERNFWKKVKSINEKWGISGNDSLIFRSYRCIAIVLLNEI